jgi:hypothetical protein
MVKEGDSAFDPTKAPLDSAIPTPKNSHISMVTDFSLRPRHFEDRQWQIRSKVISNRSRRDRQSCFKRISVTPLAIDAYERRG